VAVLNGIDDLDQNLTRVFLWQRALLLHILHQFSTLGQLHDHYQLFSLEEGVVQLHDILVPQLLDTVGLLVDIIHLVGIVHF